MEMWNNSPPPTPLDFSPYTSLYGWEDELSIDPIPLSTNDMAYDPMDRPVVDLGPSFPNDVLSQEIYFKDAPSNMLSSNIDNTLLVFEDSNDTNNDQKNYVFDQEVKFVEPMKEIQQGFREEKRIKWKGRSNGVIVAKNKYKDDMNVTKTYLSWEEISECFYIPITVAAKELNVGLTLLKKRCRELGIKRWPHRKLKSLQTLINNVQEMEKEEAEMNAKKVREDIELLSYEKRLMEEMPNLQLKDKTKRLRQACFKSNYKRRKQMIGLSSINSNGINLCFYDDKSLLMQ